MRRHATTEVPTRDAAPPPGSVARPGGEVESRSNRLVAGYRLLRRVASGDRAEVHLAVDATAETDGTVADEPPRRLVALRVYGKGADDDAIGIEIAAMGADASGTLPALVDVAVLADGRRVVAVERIGGPTLSRLLEERLLDPGEATTVLAPLVAALASLADSGFVHSRLATADVIIDDTGRPRLVGLGALRRLELAGGAVARTELLREGLRRVAELIDEVGGSTRRPAAFEPAAAIARAGAESRPFERCEGEVERALFAAAEAMPLRTGVPRPAEAPLPARVGAPSADASPVELDADLGTPRRRIGLRTVFGDLAQLPAPFVDRVAGAAETASGATLSRRIRAVAGRRRRQLVVGGAVGAAVLVLLLALVPPGDDGGAAESADGRASKNDETYASTTAPPAEGAQPDSASRPEESGASTAGRDDAAPEPAGDAGPVAAAVELLAQRAACLDAIDASCLEQVDQPGSAIERDDRAMLASAREGVAPEAPAYDLDAVSVAAQMGDAVLLRVPYAEAESEPASLLVMRGEAGWRLRELFD